METKQAMPGIFFYIHKELPVVLRIEKDSEPVDIFLYPGKRIRVDSIDDSVAVVSVQLPPFPIHEISVKISDLIAFAE